MVSERTGNDKPQADERAAPMVDFEDSEPFFMYVHYLTDEHKEQYPLYLFQIERSESPTVHLKRAIDDIIEGTVKEVPTSNDGMQHWRVLSYTAFVLNGEQRITGVTFDHQSEHYSFDEVETVSEYRDCSAVYFINKRMHSLRRRLRKGESEIVNWIVHHIPEGIVNHESSTPNTGP